MKMDPYCQWRRCSPLTLVSGSTRFVLIFMGVPCSVEGHQTTVMWSKMMIFYTFRCCIFGNLGNKASIIIDNYLVPRRVSSDPKICDIE